MVGWSTDKRFPVLTNGHEADERYSDANSGMLSVSNWYHYGIESALPRYRHPRRDGHGGGYWTLSPHPRPVAGGMEVRGRRCVKK